jgi:hypothetical protein
MKIAVSACLPAEWNMNIETWHVDITSRGAINAVQRYPFV